MMAVQNAFVLFKSDPRRSSCEVAEFISKFPGFKEVWFTEGEYSFLARFNAPVESLPALKSRLKKNKGILDLDCLAARIVLKG